MDNINWYELSKDESFEKLSSSTLGLKEDEAKNRLEKYGPNALKKEEKKPLIEKLKDQFFDPMIIILIVAAIFSAFSGEKLDSFIIVAIVIVNAFLSIYQEGKAEEAIASLQKMSTPKAKVLRDGKEIQIDSEKIVPGDIVILETGDIIPADLRLIESNNLKVDESSLTGESVPVDKDAEKVFNDYTELGDRVNLCFSSTIVSYGRAKGMVIGTGYDTEIGNIASSITSLDREETPLQKKLAGLSKSLGILVIGICIIVLVVGLLYKHELKEMFLTSISLAVAAVPEGLPAIVTIVLSIGMGKMAQKNAIVKKLLAVETLGTTTVICSDKTGTLTQNEMTVRKVFVDDKIFDVSGTGYMPKGEISHKGEKISLSDEENLYMLSSIASLTNDARLNYDNNKVDFIGDPTEVALLTFTEKIGNSIDELKEDFPRIAEIPFDSDRKMMTTFHENFFEGKVSSFTKGAADIVLSKCHKIFLNGEIQDLTDEMREEILTKNKSFAKEALRVLSYAFRNYNEMPKDLTSQSIEKDMIFVGLSGMIDPARPEVKDSISKCKSAGISTFMITGDYLETGLAIAKELGIADSEDQAVSGRDLKGLSDEEFRKLVKEKRVYTRVSPENKVQIVKALKDNGQIVAMTGDGVNDAPAIKKADIGIAMGITGTDVAKNTAEVILTDDNFATIVNAVEEGRIIYSNIKKFVGYLLSCNIGEVLIVFISIILNLPVPLIPIQLLWLNLVTDSFPALALGVEKGEDDIMDKPPREVDESIVDRNLKITVAIQAIAITCGTLVSYIVGLNWFGTSGHGLEMARSMAFTTLILSELLRSYSARSVDKTIFQIGIFSNKSLFMATLFSFLLMIAVIYIPFLSSAFKLVDLDLREWAVVLISAFFPLVIGEVQKVLRFKSK